MHKKRLKMIFKIKWLENFGSALVRKKKYWLTAHSKETEETKETKKVCQGREEKASECV